MDKIESWPFIQNFLENRTRNNFKVADILVEDHHDKLTKSISIVFINTMHTAWVPYYNAWKQAWNAWNSVRNEWHSCTRELENALAELLTSPGGNGRSLLDDWESRISAEWPTTTSMYKHFFPQGRAEFNTGAREATIQAVRNLHTRLTEKIGGLQQELAVAQAAADFYTQSNQPIPPAVQETLDTAKSRVAVVTRVSERADAFHLRLDSARGAQQGCEGAIVPATAALEKQRNRVCRQMLKNFHNLAGNYMDTESADQNPQYAAAGFFDLNVLMRPKSEDPPDDNPPPPPAPPVP